jgi:hypothetical protein
MGTCFFAKSLLGNGYRVFVNSVVIDDQQMLFIESLLSNGSTCYDIFSMRSDLLAANILID